MSDNPHRLTPEEKARVIAEAARLIEAEKGYERRVEAAARKPKRSWATAHRTRVWFVASNLGRTPR